MANYRRNVGPSSHEVVCEVHAVYEIRLPCPALRRFIECYWFVNATVGLANQLEELIFTDARADIVFTFGSPYRRVVPQQPEREQVIGSSNVDAQRRYPVRVLQHGQLNLIGVRFRPGGLAPFVRLPVHELSGYTVGLTDAFGPPGAELEGRLFETTGQHRLQARLLDEFFVSRLTILPEYDRVMGWAEAIEKRDGLVSIRSLSQDVGLSIRSVDRLFRRIIGLPPKFFARTVRLRRVHYQLMHNKTVGWEDIVASYGYFDQSHFAKDIKALTGVDLDAYRAYLSRARAAPPPNHVQFLQDSSGTAGL